MKLKNILIVTSEFPPLPGGIGNHALNLAKSLHKKDFDVTVLSDQRTYDPLELEHDHQLKFNVIRTKLRKKRVFMYFFRLFQLFELVKKNEVIIASGKFSLWMVALSSIFYKRKKIAVIHGTEVNLTSSLLMKLTFNSIKKMDSVISVSNFTKTFINDLKLSNSLVIPNGYTLENHTLEKENWNSYPNLVTVGRVSHRKGQVNVVKALPKIKEKYPKVCYHMIGIPEDKEYLNDLAKKLNVEKNIVFYGKTSYDKLYSLVNNSDVFMMLSQNDDKGDIEGFGIAILEANALSVPAIGSKGCGIEDAIDHNYSGALVDPDKVDEISLALDQILEKHSLYKTQAKEWSKKFTWEKIVNQYIDIIKH